MNDKENNPVQGLKQVFERARLGTAPYPNDVLTLDVGGTDKIRVRRRVLTHFPGSLLAAQFSGRWKNESNEEGEYFIDESMVLFEPLVNFLRRKDKSQR